MFLSLQKTVSALTESVIREQCGGAKTAGPRASQAVARFLLETHVRMPDYLRLPLTCLTMVFEMWSLPFWGTPFHRLPDKKKWEQIQAWRDSSLGFRYNFIKFYTTLIVFGWYAELYGQDYTHDVG